MVIMNTYQTLAIALLIVLFAKTQLIGAQPSDQQHLEFNKQLIKAVRERNTNTVVSLLERGAELRSSC
jgi:hypothetical protein